MSSTVDPSAIIDSAETKRAQHQLSAHLRRGELTLLLGAGVSAGLGLPSFSELVLNCERELGIVADETDYFKRMDEVNRLFSARSQGCESRDFAEFVRSHLYSETLRNDGQYDRGILQSEMLIALGALVMSSVRGSVADVLTLNFDDVLDWYLQLHGFRTQVVTSLPTWVRGDVDVHIHHIHGFLPLTGEWAASDWLLLTYDQLIERLTQSVGDPWPTLIGSLVQSKVLLAVGTSMNDIDVDVVLRQAQRLSQNGASRGFVLGRGMSPSSLEKCRRFGLTPISFESYAGIPSFILRVCQEAAKSA